MRFVFFVISLFLLFFHLNGEAQLPTSIQYKVETAGIVSDGDFAPLWFNANCYGAFSNENKQASLRTGIFYEQFFKHHWSLEAGLDVIGGIDLVSKFHFEQAYADASWKQLTVSIGAKERMGSPLDKNLRLSGGWMVEGPNVRPIPQIRGEIKDYLYIPGTHKWLAFKGHIAYGWLLDGNWQEDFAGLENSYVQDVLYHSKSLMIRIGNTMKLPAEFEFGLITAAQFGGKKLHKDLNGTEFLDAKFPHGLKQYFKIFIPKQKSTIQNVSGNYCGSWDFALNLYVSEWKFRTYYEHYFEDHSQMFWQYGRWKDGLIGLEITPTKNKWISSILWEGMSTKDQTGSVLYDGVGGTFGDLQMSGNDHYYNNFEYLGWQYYGASLGHPFLYGPQYNNDGTNSIKSSRIRSNHLGISGEPSPEWNWRLLASFVRHWGTYRLPLEKQRKQFSGLLEVIYQPVWAVGWSVSIATGIDRGNYLGNTTGGMVTLRKIGEFKL